MKQAYAIVLSPAGKKFLVYVPDFNINTEGKNIPTAMEMARDAISMAGCYLEDENLPLPQPTELGNLACKKGNIITYVDVDFLAYRKKHNPKTVRKNLTIPSWLDVKAQELGINFSKVLQDALLEKVES